MQQLVAHYAGNPTIAMWEPMNEPEASDCSNPQLGTGCYGSQTCPSEAAAAQALENFFTAVGGKIHQLDPNHLVSSGLIGSGQCGASGSDYQTVNAVSGIDVASYHDYGSDTSPIPGDRYNGLQVRINQMANINKPLMVGEVGIKANGNAAICANSLDTRTSEMQNKLATQFQQGIVGFMPWGWVPNPSTSGCSYDIGPGDPLLGMLQSHAFGFQTAAATNNSSGPSSQSSAGTTPIQHTSDPANTTAKSSGGGPTSVPKTMTYAPMQQPTNHTPAAITSLLPHTSKRTIFITFILCGMATSLLSFVLIKLHLLPRRFRTLPYLPTTLRKKAASPRTHTQHPIHTKKVRHHKLAT
jgi:hypothetical protein